MIAPPIWRCILKSIDNPETSQKLAEKSQTVSEIYSVAIFGWLREWLHKLVSDPVSLFTLVLGVFTVGLYKETAGLRAAADQQKLDTIESLRIAGVSAKAASDAVKITKAVESGVLRIEKVWPIQPPRGADMLRDRSSTRVTLVNRGRTRVDLLQVSAFLRYLDHIPSERDENPAPAALALATKQIPGTIPQDGSWTTPVMPCWEEDRLIDLTPSRPPVHRKFYAWGSVSYLTAFNETMVSEYCYVWDRRGGEWTYLERHQEDST